MLFAHDAISFIVADALSAESWNPDFEQFDVIVCFETIEHISCPDSLLKILKRFLKSDGILLVSCPNDHVDVEHGQLNLFHVRPYTLDEFKDLTKVHFGEATQWMLGSPLTGISLIDLNSKALHAEDDSILQINDFERAKETLLLPAQVGHNVQPDNCSFYLGIWNGQAEAQLVAAPMSRHAHLDPWLAMLGANKKRDEARGEIVRLKAHVESLQQCARAIRRIAALEAEERFNQRFHTSSEEWLHDGALSAPSPFAANIYSSSRVYRIAALYISSARSTNPFVKMMQFGMAVTKPALRAVGRRLSHSGS